MYDERVVRKFPAIYEPEWDIHMSKRVPVSSFPQLSKE